MKTVVTIEGVDYGEIDVPRFHRFGDYRDPEGFSFFCPHCGRVWAEIRVVGQRLFPIVVPCRDHHTYFYWPGGSIWLTEWPHITNAFNRKILEYEARRHLELYDQHQESPTT